MSLTEKSIPELEIDDAELRIMKQRLSAEKQALQGQLGELNSKCATRIPTKDFQKIQSARGQLVKQLAAKESEIGALNAERHEVLTVLEFRKHAANKFPPSDVKKLVEMRDRWHSFSMDSKNHQRAREIAWKTSQELRDFLKPYFNESTSPP
jgi:hypothetical protein